MKAAKQRKLVDFSSMTDKELEALHKQTVAAEAGALKGDEFNVFFVLPKQYHTFLTRHAVEDRQRIEAVQAQRKAKKK